MTRDKVDTVRHLDNSTANFNLTIDVAPFPFFLCIAGMQQGVYGNFPQGGMVQHVPMPVNYPQAKAFMQGKYSSLGILG